MNEDIIKTTKEKMEGALANYNKRLKTVIVLLPVQRWLLVV